MKKSLVAALVFVVSTGSAFGQFTPPIDTVFTENFDGILAADSIAANYNTDSLNVNRSWNDTSFLSTTGSNSFHTQNYVADSIIFETDAFSTVTNNNVRLTFDHICKIRYDQKAYVQISRDNGATWVNITGTQYKGESPQFPGQGWFNELSYPSAILSPFWEGPTIGGTNSGVTPNAGWWARETFDLGSYLGAFDPVNNQDGFAQCKIRFIMTNKTGFGPPNSLSGWFIDNIMVEAAPCELEPPIIDWLNVSQPAQPTGARYMPTQDVRFKGQDNIGVDSSKIYFRRYDWSAGSWTNWRDSLMTPSNTNSCPNASDFTYTFSGISVNDTIEWYVQIFDCACPNIVRSPLETATNTTFKFWREPSLPAICGVTTPSTFPLASTLPFTEDFEDPVYWVAGSGAGISGTAHRGSWPSQNPTLGKNFNVIPTQNTIGYAWSIRIGQTSSLQTGPNSDASSSITGKYIYTEASQGSNNNVTHMKPPCVNLSNLTCALLEFDYHMYGSEINKLRISIDTGRNTSNWTILEDIVGQQQTKSTDPWQKYSIDLTEYIGDYARLRFTGIRGSGTKGDIAIDNIKVYEPTIYEVALREVFNPQNGYCSYNNNELLDLWVQNNGCATLDTIPVSWSYNYTDLTGSTSTVTHTEYITNKILETGDSTFYSFATGPDLSGYGTYQISVYTHLTGDSLFSNDTVGPITIVHEEPFSNFPYVIDFDDAATVPGNNTPLNPGFFSNSVFTALPSSNSGNYAFMVGTGYTPTVGTGPISDFSKKGNYLVAEGDFGISPTSATLVSKCLDLSGLTYPVLQFRHHMYGLDIGAIRVQWIAAGENEWSNPMSPYTTTLADEKDPWSLFELDLSAQAGNIIKLRIIAQKTGLGVASDIAFDDIAIFDKANIDVGVDKINTPGARINMTGGPAAKRLNITLRNFGKQTQNNIPVSYTVTPTCGPNAGVSTTYTFTHNGSILVGTEQVAIDATNVVAWPKGTFEVYAWTTKSGDNNSWNDSAYTRSTGWPEIYINNGFVEDFENCSLGDSSGFFASGDLNLFKTGTITALGGNNGYASGVNMVTQGGLEEYLYFPRFIGFDTIAGAELRLTHDIDLGSGDVALIEFQAGGQWNTLGIWDPQNVLSTNWYNTGSSAVFDAWTGTIGQQTSVWPLYAYNYSAAPLVLRARLITVGGNKDGWNFDKVEVYVPPQNSAAPINLTTIEYLAVPNQNNHLKVNIRNTGAKILDSCLAEYSIDGGVTWTSPEKVVFNPPLIPRKTAWYNFKAPWVNPSSGVQNICVRTSLPDNKPDNDTSDDLICKDITVLNEINMSVDSSYCNNFDDPSMDSWLTLNTFVKDGNSSWEKGTPNNGPIVSTNSGANAWVTDLNANYQRRDSSSLFTPVFAIDSGQIYTYEFMHQFSTELYHDGGTIDITFDGGITWHTIGTNLFGATWFNTSFVTSLDVYNPGWTGLSGGWIPAKINLSVDTSRNAIFRFRFASDETINKAGWAIDDFCFYENDSQDRVYVIGEEELKHFIGVGKIHPNPTSGYAQLPISFQNEADVTITIRNTQGQLMMTQKLHGKEGINTFPIQTNGWASGMYLVETLSPLGTDIQRLIVE